MIVLCVEEFIEFDDFRHDRFGKPPGFSQCFFGFFREPPLLFIMIKNGASVLRSPVTELSSRVRGVHVSPEELEQLLIADF